MQLHDKLGATRFFGYDGLAVVNGLPREFIALLSQIQESQLVLAENISLEASLSLKEV